MSINRRKLLNMIVFILFIYVKKSILKALTKNVLKEIYSEPQSERGLVGFLSSLMKVIGGEDRPEFNQIDKAHALAHKILRALKIDVKTAISEISRRNKSGFEESIETFNHHREQMINFLVMWAQNIDDHDYEKRDKISHPMEGIKTHLNEMAGQLHQIFLSLMNKNDFGGYNMINARNQINHLNEIFESMRVSIDELFQIGIDAGLRGGKKLVI